MTHHHYKLLQEIEDLKEKMRRLNDFIETDERATNLHRLQLSAMNTYLAILIERFETEK